VPEIRAALGDGDLAVVTADHGNDPTWRGTDHTREHAPILAFGPDVATGPIGRRDTFADVAASVAAHLGVRTEAGVPFLRNGRTGPAGR
jgi:phosphopentomutase